MKHKINVDYGLALEIIDKIKNDPMGAWFELPDSFPKAELERIKVAADKINRDSDFLVCIGIGGSYLGARAVYEALNPEGKTKLLFAGNSLSSSELEKVIKELDGKDFSLNVISKSGTTLEPAVAFRILKAKLIERYGVKEARKRIYVTTDPETGALREEAKRENYTSFTIPQGVGGRYSILSSVGLFPLCVAGVDIEELMEGARRCKLEQTTPDQIKSSTLIDYAFTRFSLYREKGCDVEVLASFEPSLLYFNEWWKQLFGESEGKNQQGIFPASVIYSTDLHSLGQYLQDGRRNIFETFLHFGEAKNSVVVPALEENLDGLKYLEGRALTEISDKALKATITAHESGGIPVIELDFEDAEKPGLSERVLGYLMFFFETACALSSILHGVNPFDQPGVEEYKKEMFRLLGRK